MATPLREGPGGRQPSHPQPDSVCAKRCNKFLDFPRLGRQTNYHLWEDLPERLGSGLCLVAATMLAVLEGVEILPDWVAVRHLPVVHQSQVSDAPALWGGQAGVR